MRECEAMAVVVSAQGVGYTHRDAALAAAGSALALLADPNAYSAELGRGGVQALRGALAGAERMLDALERDGIHLIIRADARYPARLAQTAKPPHLLFCTGNPDLNVPFPLAVVGTRRADGYGLRCTRAISRDLAQEGVCIVSGLALGIDAAAHQGALDAGGQTIAVLGGALDQFYPMENRGLMQEILKNGGSVISEYAPGTRPGRYTFLHRNRIIAGMSLGVLVTQAPVRSGAKSTANHALDEGREVFALPGDIDREGSALPNRLIAEGAHMAVCAGDILSQLVIEQRTEPPAQNQVTAAHKQTPASQAKHKAETVRREASASAAQIASAAQEPEDELEKAVYRILREGEADFDMLSERTGASSDDLGAALMMLELDGVIEALAGLRYRLA